MLRPNPRFLLRSKNPLNPALLNHPRSFLIQNRLASTTSPQKSRSWKSLFVRVGLAAGVVYFYNTSSIFAEEPAYAIPTLRPSTEDDELALPITNSLTTPRPATAPVPTLASQPHLSADETNRASPTSPNTTRPWDSPSSTTRGPQLEETAEEATQQGAFNEETGEINWDCPCLGGMAHGTCGEHFRAAFSCFVYSKEDPKGMDCIEHFKTMQGCFREHPDEYGAELEDVEDENETHEGENTHAGVGEEAASATATTRHSGDEDGIPRYPSGEPLPESARKGLQAAESHSTSGSAPLSPSSSSTTSASTPTSSASSTSSSSSTDSAPTQRAKAAKSEVAAKHSEPVSESEDLVPKAAHDARGTAQDGKF